VTYLGTVLSSFPEAHRASETLLETLLGIKRIERITERIGGQRVAWRDAEAAAWRKRPLVEKERAPQGVKPPAVAAVSCDGGRLQLRQPNADSATHWHEYKAGCLLELKSVAVDDDPCPEVPATFLEREHIETLAREIGHQAAETSGPCDPPASPPAPAPGEPVVYEPPSVVSKDVVASCHGSRAFGVLLAAAAWQLGMFGAQRKAFVGDGQNWIWKLWERHFKAFQFVPILDFIHALTYVYAAATAGRCREAGWTVYVRWITWVWQGEVGKVIAELAVRQQDLGLPTEADGSSSPQRIVSEALTYLQNQQSRMKYPQYRRQGLPVTSSHMESTVKQLNHRVKGSEKFWSDQGAEAVLQLRADSISDSDPLAQFWRERPTHVTGCRTYRRHAA
jgi:hypothetical protein